MKRKSIKRWVLWSSLSLFIIVVILGGLLPNFLLSWLGIFADIYYAWPVYPFYFIALIVLSHNLLKTGLILSIISLFFCIALIGYNTTPMYLPVELWASYALFVIILGPLIYAFCTLWLDLQQLGKRIWFTIATLTIILFFISGYFFIFRYWATVNSHPKYFMIIKGNVASKLIDKVKLQWTATYKSTNNQCDKIYDYVNGSYQAREKEKVFAAHPSATGDYQIKIPFDYYKPGFCQWKIAKISRDVGTFIQFYPYIDDKSYLKKPINNVLKANQSNICKFTNDKLNCKYVNNYTSFSESGDIFRNRNYTLIENYYLR